MKKFVLIPLMTVLVTGLILGAFNASAAPPKVIKLNYSDQNPKKAAKVAQIWIKQMEEATKGRVKFNEYYGGTLVKGMDAWEGIKSGITDVAWCVHPYWPGMTPLSDVVNLPFIPFESAEQSSAVLWQLYEKFPTLREQYKDNKVLSIFAGPSMLLMREKQVKTPEDIKGLKIRVTGGPPTEMIKLLRATPVMFGMGDSYSNLQKGVIDGMVANWLAAYAFKLYENVKYVTRISTGAVYFTVSMNWDTWNSLPADVQQQIMSVNGIEGSKLWGRDWMDAGCIAGRDGAAAKGYKVAEYWPSPEEQAMWTEVAGRPLWEKWVKNMEAAGHPEAREILNTTLELIKTYKP